MEDDRKRMYGLIAVVIVAIGCGWVGHYLDASIGEARVNTLGQLVWLVSPLLAVLAVKSINGGKVSPSGLKISLRGNGTLYLFSILFYPMLVSILLVITRMFGWVTFNHVESKVLIAVLLNSVATSFPKNVFEEFAWRGYLVPEFASLGVKPLLNHLLVGVVWATWHVPYLYVFTVQIET